MPIIADIEDLAPAELLLVLSLTRKTGRLCATHDGQKILLALSEGSIVYAASPAVRERLGSILVNRGAVSERELQRALDRQSQEVEPRVLGTILVEMGLVSATTIHEAVHCQFEAVLRHLMAWDSGVMTFQESRVPDLGAVPIDPVEAFAGIGRTAREQVAEGMARLALMRPESTEDEGADGDPGPASDDGSAPPEPAGNESVRAMLREMDRLSVSLTAEMTMAILQSAAEIAPRALLLLAYPDYLGGVGGFGRSTDGRPVAGRQLRLPLHKGSVFARVVDRGEVYRGLLELSDAEALEDPLGHLPAGEVLLVPMAVRGGVVAVLYADGGPKGESIGEVRTLQSVMGKVAAALAEDHEAEPQVAAAG
jgi:hypothetical protein